MNKRGKRAVLFNNLNGSDRENRFQTEKKSDAPLCKVNKTEATFQEFPSKRSKSFMVKPYPRNQEMVSDDSS